VVFGAVAGFQHGKEVLGIGRIRLIGRIWRIGMTLLTVVMREGR
jgi:hypothetical protein